MIFNLYVFLIFYERDHKRGFYRIYNLQMSILKTLVNHNEKRDDENLLIVQSKRWLPTFNILMTWHRYLNINIHITDY